MAPWPIGPWIHWQMWVARGSRRVCELRRNSRSPAAEENGQAGRRERWSVLVTLDRNDCSGSIATSASGKVSNIFQSSWCFTSPKKIRWNMLRPPDQTIQIAWISWLTELSTVSLRAIICSSRMARMKAAAYVDVLLWDVICLPVLEMNAAFDKVAPLAALAVQMPTPHFQTNQLYQLQQQYFSILFHKLFHLSWETNNNKPPSCEWFIPPPCINNVETWGLWFI